MHLIQFVLFQCNFKIDILESEAVDMDAITAEVIGPSGPVYLDLDMSELAAGAGGGTARATFTTDEVGMHQVLVKNEGETVKGTPHYLRSMPKSKKDYDGNESLISFLLSLLLIHLFLDLLPYSLGICLINY